MLTVTTDKFTKHQPGEYCAEASDLGWPPGGWPIEFMLCNGCFIVKMQRMSGKRDIVGDLLAVQYRSRYHRQRVTVYND